MHEAADPANVSQVFGALRAMERAEIEHDMVLFFRLWGQTKAKLRQVEAMLNGRTAESATEE